MSILTKIVLKVMANLLYGTHQPRVMDIKIGQRTFQEDEVSNQKTRMDLLKKMMDVSRQASCK